MPYKIVGRKVMHKKAGRWSVKQTAKSKENAVKTVRLLRYLENKKR